MKITETGKPIANMEEFRCQMNKAVLGSQQKGIHLFQSDHMIEERVVLFIQLI